MRITFEWNDGEEHMIKWCLFKYASYIGSHEETKIEYKHKAIISNVWEIPKKFTELLKEVEE